MVSLLVAEPSILIIGGIDEMQGVMADIVDDIAEQKKGPESGRYDRIVKIEELAHSKISYRADEYEKRRG